MPERKPNISAVIPSSLFIWSAAYPIHAIEIGNNVENEEEGEQAPGDFFCGAQSDPGTFRRTGYVSPYFYGYWFGGTFLQKGDSRSTEPVGREWTAGM